MGPRPLLSTAPHARGTSKQSPTASVHTLLAHLEVGRPAVHQLLAQAFKLAVAHKVLEVQVDDEALPRLQRLVQGLLPALALLLPLLQAGHA